MKEKLMQEFERIFGGTEDVRLFFAPGRVNMIGEHTDYNGGHVFPCALTIGTYAAARRNGMDTCRFYSMNFEHLGIIAADLEELEYDKEQNDWANYPMGIIAKLREAGITIDEGMDFVFCGNIPNSSGLSSSASIEVLTAFACRELFGFEMDFVEMSKLAQKAENEFIGVNCGIMDQFAIAMGKKDHAIFLDTADLSYEYAPLVLENAKIVIACSNKKRGLGDSKYNERRSECEAALALLQTKKNIKSLGELSEAEFEEIKDVIGDEVKTRRAKHAVYENQRTIRAVEALKAKDVATFGQLMNASHVSLRDDYEAFINWPKDVATFGQLMNASHVSLRDDYEVTGVELDTLVETAWTVDGVIGSRMTGAGFGGCTVSIVKEDCVENFIQTVGEVYKNKIGYAADFYVVDIGSGPVEL